MAVTQTLVTEFGENRELYVRVNNLTANNHGEGSTTNHGGINTVLFRGYYSEEAFRNSGRFVWELEMNVVFDVSLALWPQAYTVLKSTPDFADAVDC